jgi:hypothetical protein
MAKDIPAERECLTLTAKRNQPVASDADISVPLTYDSEQGLPSLKSSQPSKETPAKCECRRLRAKLEKRTGQLEYANRKLEAEEARVDAECKERIRKVREFWIHKIYNESSRPGKILKRAMQKRT